MHKVWKYRYFKPNTNVVEHEKALAIQMESCYRVIDLAFYTYKDRISKQAKLDMWTLGSLMLVSLPMSLYLFLCSATVILSLHI